MAAGRIAGFARVGFIITAPALAVTGFLRIEVTAVAAVRCTALTFGQFNNGCVFGFLVFHSFLQIKKIDKILNKFLSLTQLYINNVLKSR